MDRGADSTWIAELIKSRNQPIFLIEAAFDAADGGSIYLTNAFRSVSWNGATWNANGHFLGFTGLSESWDMTIPNVRVTLSAVDQTWIAIALSKNYIDRPLRIWKTFLDNQTALIGTPVLLFDGRLDSLEITDDPDAGTCTLAAAASSQWVDFDRKPGRHTNSSEQQIFYPGDLGFDYASQGNKEIRWGSAG